MKFIVVKKRRWIFAPLSIWGMHYASYSLHVDLSCHRWLTTKLRSQEMALLLGVGFPRVPNKPFCIEYFDAIYYE